MGPLCLNERRVHDAGMDTLAHGLWAGIGIALVHRRWPMAPRLAAATVGLAVLPDLVHLLPVAAAALFAPQGWAMLSGYATALPGQEPALPVWSAALAHHLHCVMHSVVVAAPVSALLSWWLGRLWWPLLGWWSHIVIDVFTHSASFYPVPVLYPLTMRGFDGLAWNTPWFMWANYSLLLVCGVALAWRAWRHRLG